MTATPVAVTTPVSAPPPDTTAPSVPAGLTGTALSSTQVNLTWNASTDNVGVTGYYVYLNDAPLTTTTATSFQHTGLTAGTTYNYRVSAYDAVPNHSAWTAVPVAVKTLPAAPPPDTAAPSIPGGLNATASSASQINLAWSPSADNVAVTGYRVYRAGALIATTAALSYADAGLAASTSFSYYVAAFDAAGNASAPSTAVSTTTLAPPDTSAPSVPGGLGAVATSSSRISLTWSASTDNVAVAGYRVYRGSTQIATTATLAYTDVGLAASTTYSYTLSAFDGAGNVSANSAAVTARTQNRADTSKPSVPGGLSASAVTGRLISLSWTASTDNVGVTGYNVYRGGVQIAAVSTPSYADAGVSPSTRYSYQVTAFDAAGNTSSKSATASATTPVARVANDFNGDGKSDILWRNGVTGEDRIWFMNGATVASNAATTPVPDLNWSIAGTGDFNGDGKADIVWRNRATGDNAIWLMNGTTMQYGTTFSTVADQNLEIVGVGDFDGDGKADILWRNRATGANVLWFMNGATIVSSATLAPIADLNWSVAGIGDFDGDGKADILWRNKVTGENLVHFMDGGTLRSALAINPVADLNWGISGVGDFDGDGKSDVLWRNKVTGENAIFLMNGATVLSTIYIRPIADLNWSVAEVGDYNGDGKADILWRNSVTGEDGFYLMNGGTVTAVLYTTSLTGADWLIAQQ